MHEISVPIRDEAGTVLGSFALSRLPGRTDLLSVVDERVVVTEDGTYVYSIELLDGAGDVAVAPGDELFSFDDSSRRRGRLTPRQHVGRIRVRVQATGSAGWVTLSVEPRKLEAETEYRQMLDDIAGVATEAILQGFAPAAVALRHETAVDPRLLYQQFAFLHARLLSDQGQRDLALVVNRPHTNWRDEDELQLPGRPMRGGSRNIRALSAPGPRLKVGPNSRLPSLPSPVHITQTRETLDTEPNRFVRFALERWRELARQVFDLVAAMPPAGPVSRGLDAAQEVCTVLDRALAAAMFREVGRLTTFPSGNQVLQKRAGYRELLRTFVLTETGARLALDWELDDVFGASQRNVATLYEYWAFLQLATVVGRACGAELTADGLQLAEDGMSLGFRQGAGSGLNWTTLVRGRDLEVELFFNRTFAVSSLPDSSWSRAMRPDCSVRIRPIELAGGIPADDLVVWLHFDAKYRVEYVNEQFAPPTDSDENLAVESERTERLARSKREDLLKMHAYRDAIRRSAGAFVLYPGQQEQPHFTEHHELLPGLGAFVLRPSADGAAGTEQLQRFVSQVLEHVADRASQHERSRYWRAVIHKREPAMPDRDRRLPSLPRPPADVPILCGYVRSVEHRDWIEDSGLYNVRAGDRRGAIGADSEILRASDLVLYGAGMPPTLWSREGAWFVQSRDDLLGAGYPRPRGAVYLCCVVRRRVDEPEWIRSLDLAAVSRRRAEPSFAPFGSTWQELLELAG